MDKTYTITGAQRQGIINIIAAAIHPSETFRNINNILTGLSDLPEVPEKKVE